MQALNRSFPPTSHLPVPVPPNLRQRTLSAILDKGVAAALAAPATGREAFRAHFQLLQEPGAGA